MKRNGFTLIELLAVIVILAIIALIATPIILGIINDAREESNERSVELYVSAVRNAVAAYQLTNPNAPTKFTDLDVQYEGNVECSVKELYQDGNFYLEGCTVNGSEKTYSYGEQQGTEKACTLDDKDGDGVASLNDMITCATESFHVMSNDGTVISMLSQYNLDVGKIWDENDGMMEKISSPTGIQSELAKAKVLSSSEYYGVIEFSSSGYGYWLDENQNLLPEYGTGFPVWVYDENSTLYSHIETYETYLKQNGVSSANSTLISYEQVIDLKNNKGNPSWLYTTTYWTGTANETTNIWYVSPVDGINADLGHGSDGIANMGLRPVVNISVNEI